jgi:hypothetical protein
LKELHFHDCKFAQPTCEQEIQALEQGNYYSFDDSLPSNINKISFFRCGIKHENDWYSYPERLEGILASLAKTQVKYSVGIIKSF